jgi:putative phosphoesterase
MRILVASDTHRDFYSLQQAVLQQPKAEVVIHLGDGEDDAEQIKILYPQKMILQVRGNCDWGSMLPAEGEITFEGKHIFYTHGHNYNVKYGMYTVVMAARDALTNIINVLSGR